MTSVTQKTRFKVPASKARNPLVAPALLRKAGAHRQSEKSLRQQSEQQMRKALKQD
jgi:hypothetical protein